jgi:hypothetical protein
MGLLHQQLDLLALFWQHMENVLSSSILSETAPKRLSQTELMRYLIQSEIGFVLSLVQIWSLLQE